MTEKITYQLRHHFSGVTFDRGEAVGPSLVDRAAAVMVAVGEDGDETRYGMTLKEIDQTISTLSANGTCIPEELHRARNKTLDFGINGLGLTR